MLGVTENELTDKLALIGALFHDLAVVLEKMVQEKFVEVLLRSHRILINLPREGLAEEQSVHEASRNRLQLPKEHQ